MNNLKTFFLTFSVAATLLLLFSFTAKSEEVTFASGAYIIDMGQSSQTVAKGLKPYGLVYQLIVTHHVPVNWAINPSKVKDGTDFTVNSKAYKAGSFIIPAEYITPAVISTINTWKGKGVVVDGPIATSFVAPVFKELTSWPLAVLDDKNDQIVAAYYTAAEVPSASYTLAGDPTMLTGCGDLYVLPHADPPDWPASWVTALDNFVKYNQGYLWSACHAVSRLEAPVTGNNNTTGVGLNFLSVNGLYTEKQHDDGSGSYTYNPAYNSDPVMQFLGKLDAATTNGSEQIYIPYKTTGSWRSTTKVAAYQPTHSQANPNEAAVLVYGHAYGNPDYGMVMYEAGHNHSGTAAANVAAMRAYFNFVLLAGVQKQMSVSTTVPSVIFSGSTVSFSTNITNGTPPITYQWSSSVGSFSAPNAATTNFTAPTVTNPTTVVINLLVTDNCTRFNSDFNTVVIRQPIGPDAVNDVASTNMNVPVNITVLANDVQGDGALVPSTVVFTSAQPNPATQGVFTVNPSTGVVTFTPVTTFTGNVNINYRVCDEMELCDDATITVTVNSVAGPTANNDNASTTQLAPVNINVLSNDVAGAAAIDPTTVTFVDGTAPNPSTVGSFTVNPTSGLVTFTPVSTFAGNATISYRVCDLNTLCSTATITVAVSAVAGPVANDDEALIVMNTVAEILVLDNDVAGATSIDPLSLAFIPGTAPNPVTEGVFTINPSNYHVTFTPAEDFYGTASIQYQICDANNLCDIATITVNVIVGASNLYPALGPGTLAFEDLWPAQGDYDFNDLVIDYQFEVISNLSNNIERVIGTFVLKATGASLHNGFGFQFPENIDANDLTVTGTRLTENYITLSSNGTENGQSKPTIIVFDNSYTQLINPGVALGVNTVQSAPYVDPVTIVINIEFTPNAYSFNELNISAFNPFLIVDQTRGIEVHLPNYPPTDLVDPTRFGTLGDDSNPGTGRYYVTGNNLPWAINIYESFDYAIEKTDILEAHLKFGEWATSGGTLYPDWYKDLPGYRNSSKIYQIPSKK